jgi:beta-1,2-mannobiose phosphorylase / 1,2-beta-oligomannan phosphorylase
MQKQWLIHAQDLQPSRPDFVILGVFNPAVTTFHGESILMARVAETIRQTDKDRFIVPFYAHHHYDFMVLPRSSPDYDFSDARVIKNHKQNYLTSVSHFRIAHSLDGVHFTFAPEDIIFPDTPYETYGIEDPRITLIDGRYYITYSAVSDYGINVGLMVTDDFKHFERLGLIFPSDNKDCVLFPEKIKGRYVAFHRPSATEFGKLDMWTATSNDLQEWGHHQAFSEARITYAPSVRVGAGAVPFLTPKGWLVIYHSADEHHHYHLTAMLLDKDDPHKILAKSKRPLLVPSEPYELNGFVNHVVFSCGVIPHQDSLTIYYGVCDEHIASATLTMAEVWENLEAVK